MSKIVKADLGTGKAAYTEILDNDILNTKRLISALNVFCEDTKLKGEDYDVAKEIIVEYIKLLESKMTMSLQLIADISISSEKFSNFMEDYEVLDNSEFEELAQRISYISSLRSSIEQILYKATSGTESMTGAERRDYQNRLNYYYTVIGEIRNKLDKLYALDGTDAEIYNSIIAPKLEEIQNFRNQINT